MEQIDLLFGQTLGKEENASKFLSILLQHAREGHLCISREEVKEIDISSLPPFVVCHNERYYLQKNWDYERAFLENIERLRNAQVEKRDPQISDHLSIEQREAVIKALHHPLTIITGGPGTGKTFTAAQIVKAFGSENILLMAPTGKAAAKLGLSMGGIPCGTIHSFLQRAYFADLIIVDECSMIDAKMFPKLLSSIQSGSRVVLMGDPAQLPSIEGGTFFADLIDSQKVICTQLKRNFRSENEEINGLAFAILENNPQDALKEIEPFLVEGDVLDYARRGFHILCCMRQGPMGADHLNEKILPTLSSENESVPILITRNDYDLDLYNGETGVVKNGIAYFSGNKKFLVHELPPYEYGYCISVHKSQGSEYENVLLLVPEGSEIFGKEMLYTGVTRAKKQLKIMGNKLTLEQMLNKKSNRMSGLSK